MKTKFPWRGAGGSLPESVYGTMGILCGEAHWTFASNLKEERNEPSLVWHTYAD